MMKDKRQEGNINTVLEIIEKFVSVEEGVIHFSLNPDINNALFDLLLGPNIN